MRGSPDDVVDDHGDSCYDTTIIGPQRSRRRSICL